VPLAIARFRLIVAVTATIFAFAFVALVILAGGEVPVNTGLAFWLIVTTGGAV
jgi:hypothetical protein